VLRSSDNAEAGLLMLAAVRGVFYQTISHVKEIVRENRADGSVTVRTWGS
jgi:hypothetical protein